MEIFKVFIEIPIGSAVKYEFDEEAKEIRVDRFLYATFHYPFNYGYIIGSRGKDGDPLDVVVISSEPVYPGIVMDCHAVGLLETEDESGVDAKIIAVPTEKIDPFYGIYKDIGDVPKPMLDKIKHFYQHYKTIEPGKWVRVKDFLDVAMAKKEIAESLTEAK